MEYKEISKFSTKEELLHFIKNKIFSEEEKQKIFEKAVFNLNINLIQTLLEENFYPLKSDKIIPILIKRFIKFDTYKISLYEMDMNYAKANRICDMLTSSKIDLTYNKLPMKDILLLFIRSDIRMNLLPKIIEKTNFLNLKFEKEKNNFIQLAIKYQQYNTLFTTFLLLDPDICEKILLETNLNGETAYEIAIKYAPYMADEIKSSRIFSSAFLNNIKEIEERYEVFITKYIEFSDAIKEKNTTKIQQIYNEYSLIKPNIATAACSKDFYFYEPSAIILMINNNDIESFKLSLKQFPETTFINHFEYDDEDNLTIKTLTELAIERDQKNGQFPYGNFVKTILEFSPNLKTSEVELEKILSNKPQ